MTVDTYKQEVRVKAVLAACSSDTRRVARMWLYYTLFYWMFPTLAVLFTYLLANQPVKLLDLVIHGEFLIYAITIVAGSTRLIAKDIPSRGPFVSRQGFNLVSHVMIFPAIVAYALLRYTSAVSANAYAVNTKLVVVYSIVLLVAAFIFSYVVLLIDAQRSTPEKSPHHRRQHLLMPVIGCRQSSGSCKSVLGGHLGKRFWPLTNADRKRGANRAQSEYRTRCSGSPFLDTTGHGQPRTA